MKFRILELIYEISKIICDSFVKKLWLRKILTVGIILFSNQLFGQTMVESQVLKVSADMFRWEVKEKFDSLATLFDDQLVVIGSTGTKRSKTEYLDNLKNGRPIHNSIDVQKSSATIHGETAIVVGNGLFVTTTGGTQTTNHLSYMEVFVYKNKCWKLVALYATRLPE